MRLTFDERVFLKKLFPEKTIRFLKVIFCIPKEILVSLQAFWLGSVTTNDETGSIKLLAEAE